jgi:hypothetical protein
MLDHRFVGAEKLRCEHCATGFRAVTYDGEALKAG